MPPSIIVDDADLTLLIGAQWQRFTNSSAAHNRTTTVCRTDLNGKGIANIKSPTLTLNLPSLKGFTLVGTGAENLRLNYTFRNNDAPKDGPVSTNPELFNKTGVELMTLTSTDTHTIEIVPDSGRFTLDYVLFTPDKESGYIGQRLMSDDHDGTIKYTAGQWSLTESVVLPRAIPMKGTLAKATAVGASFSVEFTVTHVNGSQAVNGDSWLMSQPFFKQNVAPGTHTLNVTLTEVTGNQSYYFDYLTFQGIDQTQLNATGAGKKSNTLGGIIGGVIAAIIILGCCGAWGKKKYYYVRRPVVYVKETVIM
ncbi:hypothetical protein EST38_g1474 [Candolleomyces aberdarensis]|uniref:Uncharacterized protein n=1 Tax=Candolleomyces aberdarensis TaxID=2316362 RepID=A0A4Q2DVN8_9AGAR|nr:hypothetical protein EST38_g1474 [Candolleomyces aberdarensis]